MLGVPFVSPGGGGGVGGGGWTIQRVHRDATAHPPPCSCDYSVGKGSRWARVGRCILHLGVPLVSSGGWVGGRLIGRYRGAPRCEAPSHPLPCDYPDTKGCCWAGVGDQFNASVSLFVSSWWVGGWVVDWTIHRVLRARMDGSTPPAPRQSCMIKGCHLAGVGWCSSRLGVPTHRLPHHSYVPKQNERMGKEEDHQPSHPPTQTLQALRLPSGRGPPAPAHRVWRGLQDQGRHRRARLYPRDGPGGK